MENSYLPKRFDVTGKVDGIGGPLSVAAWIFPPQGEARGVWFCLPGEGSTKAYYHLLVPGHPVEDYSFALHMVRQGFIVIAIDHLGTGESTHPEGDDKLITSERIAAANSEVVRQVSFGLLVGTLHPEVPAFSYPLAIIGLGHSWGGKLLLMQEGTNHCFNAIGILGWSNHYILPTGVEPGFAEAAGQESPEQIFRQATSRERRVDRHGFFFAPDVPSEVMVADYALATSFPAGVLTEDRDPTLMLPIAEKIRIPVFLCLSLVNGTIDLKEEEKTYPSGLVFSYVLPGSHHCHNFASSRELLWTLLEGWAKGILKYTHS